MNYFENVEAKRAYEGL